MSNYTTTLRNICESEEGKKQEVLNLFQSYELSDFLTQKQIDVINQAGLWSKEKLAQLILDEYYFREIGFETYGLFCHFAKLEMQKLMEYYLPYIYSMSIEYDPLVNVDFTETFERTANEEGNNTNSLNGKTTNEGTTHSTQNATGTAKSTGNATNNSDTIFSDTPNTGLQAVKERKICYKCYRKYGKL